MNLDEVIIHAREMRFADKTEDELNKMLIVCGNSTGQGGGTFADRQISHAVKIIHEELSRRQRDKNHLEAIAELQRQNQQAGERGKTLHGETMGELEKLKLSVDQLARARSVDRWILVVGAIAAIAGVVAAIAGLIALFPKH